MEILKLNKISNAVNDIFDEKYTLVDESVSPAAILVRSYDMNTKYDLPSSVLAVGRAGAGVNNIPCQEYAEKGVVVFNSPGANANAVKELIICSLLISARDIIGGANWSQSLINNPDAPKLVEKNKSKFGGTEIFNKTIGIIGLGAIGRKVAEACTDLGMKVVGYDPYLNETIQNMLPATVTAVDELSKLFALSDYITLHVPYNANTKGIVNAEAFDQMKNGVVLLNFARGELVDNEALFKAIENKKVAKYVTDFVNTEVLGKENVIALPHLGASTVEAEDNCAIMASNEIKDYIELGNIGNSVNFPNVALAKNAKNRLTVCFKSVENELSDITKLLADNNIGIVATASATKGEIGYLIFDSNDDLSVVKDELSALKNVLRVRLI